MLSLTYTVPMGFVQDRAKPQGDSPTIHQIRQTKPGDSCQYQGRRYYIKRIGVKLTTLITVSDYQRYGTKRSKGFSVSTSDISHIRYNFFHRA